MDEQKQKDFENIRIHYGFHRGNEGRDQWGKKVKLPSFIGYMTNMGIIEVNDWVKLAEQTIKKYGEEEIFELLKQPKYHFPFMSEKDIYLRALELHIGRIFERPQWVQYDEFRKECLLKNEVDMFQYLSRMATDN